ncbi:hypothetical protein Tco_1045000 [Tanacetum coccineum]|uniref:Uncharacterized protein n=1 Tax=Tanacetum coccineum TaxID=301880 RepID=A0ABQ5GRI5_9ASTR
MMTYLKHVGNFKHSELKTKKFEEIKALYEKIKRSDEDFISIRPAEDERLIKKMNEKGIDSSTSEVIRRRSKRRFNVENKEEESPEKRKLAEHLEEINQNVVIRSNGQKRYFSTLMRVLSIFDRDDLNAIYQLVMDKYQDEIPGGFDKVLWGDLMVMFNPDDEDKFWNSQQDWNIGSQNSPCFIDEELASSKIKQLLVKTNQSVDVIVAKNIYVYEMHHVMAMKHWLVQKQTVFGKDKSNSVEGWTVYQNYVAVIAEKTKIDADRRIG